MSRSDYGKTDTKLQYERLESDTSVCLDEATNSLTSDADQFFKTSLARASSLCSLIHMEMSLLPKPIAQYRSLVASLDKLLSLFSGLRSIRQHIPHKLTVIDLLPQRTEFVSSMLVTLYAISHSLHMRSPVPQFLPQPRHFLNRLVAAIEEHIEEAYARTSTYGALPLTPLAAPSSPETVEAFPNGLTEHPASSNASHSPFHATPCVSTSYQTAGNQQGPEPIKLGFSLAFALAETEAISEAVEAMDRILAICKTLFGTASFIQAEEAPAVDLTNGFSVSDGMSDGIAAPRSARLYPGDAAAKKRIANRHE